jgi:hypothetical protein
MSMLRNLEAKLGGLVEGAFGRAFRTSVQPVELAHKLAKEMEDNQMASVSRVYVPNHYRVYLSAQDREQFASYEPALRKELSDYLLEHARQEQFALSTRPQVEFHTTSASISASSGFRPSWSRCRRRSVPRARPARRPRRATSATRWSTPRAATRARSSRSTIAVRRCSWAGPPQRAEREPRRHRAQPRGDIVLQDPNVSRRHAELRREDGAGRSSTSGRRTGSRSTAGGGPPAAAPGRPGSRSA